MAETAAAWLETAERDNGERFIRHRSDAPEWLTDMMREAAHDHGEILPDDYRYQFASDALDIIAEDGTDEDHLRDVFGEIQGDDYTSDLCAWLGSHGNRRMYVDEELSEYPHNDGYTLLVDAQRRERVEVAEAVFVWLAEYIENQGGDPWDSRLLVR
jgi:hypothetical protein